MTVQSVKIRMLLWNMIMNFMLVFTSLISAGEYIVYLSLSLENNP